jgi:hypothetical protein
MGYPESRRLGANGRSWRLFTGYLRPYREPRPCGHGACHHQGVGGGATSHAGSSANLAVYGQIA